MYLSRSKEMSELEGQMSLRGKIRSIDHVMKGVIGTVYMKEDELCVAIYMR